MRTFICPHCQGEFSIPTNSAFVTGRENLAEDVNILPAEEYHPDPEKVYKTHEAVRRVGLAYYWKNREKVLAKAKAKRLEVKRKLAALEAKT